MIPTKRAMLQEKSDRKLSGAHLLPVMGYDVRTRFRFKWWVFTLCIAVATVCRANDVPSAVENDSLFISVSCDPIYPAEERIRNYTERIYTSVDQMPQFPGGETELLKWISKNIKYPENAAQKHIQGRVIVKCIVKSDGSIDEVQVKRGVDPDLDEEAVRVVESLPRFIPGKMNGEAVNVWYHVPVRFRLQDNHIPVSPVQSPD